MKNVERSSRILTGLQSPSGLVEGLKDCVEGLKRWSQHDLGHVTKKIQEKKKRYYKMWSKLTEMVAGEMR